MTNDEIRMTGASRAGKLLRGLLAIALAFAGTSCEAIKAQRAREAAEQRARAVFVRDEPAEPFVTARLFYGSTDVVKRMIELQDDVASSFRGMRRVGDGLISVGVKDGRGRWLRTHECGGHLFVEAAQGQPCQIVVTNHARTRLEVLAGLDGADASAGGSFNLENRGLIVPPLQTVVFGKVKRRQPPALRFGPGRDPARGPVVETHVAPSDGSILIAVFRERGRFPWEGSLPQSMRPSALPGKLPQRQFEPEPHSHDYR